MADSSGWDVVIVAGLGLVGTVVSPVVAPFLQARLKRKETLEERELAERARRRTVLYDAIVGYQDATSNLMQAVARKDGEARLAAVVALNAAANRFDLEVETDDFPVAKALHRATARLMQVEATETTPAGSLAGSTGVQLTRWRSDPSAAAAVGARIEKAVDEFERATGRTTKPEQKAPPGTDRPSPR
jgi:hypothetical protein